MKARPRSVENRVADALNDHFTRIGMSKVERIPVLGRTGPDISLNEMKLVIDVKSRIEVPKALFFPLVDPFRFNIGSSFLSLYGVRLCCLNALWEEDFDERPIPTLDFNSKIVNDYLKHMDEWTAANCKDGVSCVILHRPEMPIGSSVAVIQSTSRRRLIEHAREYDNNRLSLSAE